MEPRSREVVIFDDKCPMCTFQSRLLTRLDWRGRLEFMPLSGGAAQALVPNVTREQLLEAMHVVARDGRVFRGARAIRHISARLPLLWLLWLLLWIPGVIYLSEAVYRCISRNRHVLSRVFGCKGACELLPEKPPRDSQAGKV